jgi:hypothetical protein
MRSQGKQITLKLIPPEQASTIIFKICENCIDLVMETPILYQLLLDTMGIIDPIEEEQFLDRYHSNGHSLFARTSTPKELESTKS